MTAPSPQQAAYRVRESYRKGDLPKRYRCTYEMLDERSGQVMAACDLVGDAAFVPQTLFDHRQEPWQMTPNRKIMPSRWALTDPGGAVVVQFNQKILGKLVNPLYRTFLSLEDGDGRERYRLIDPRTNIPDRVFGLAPGTYAIVSGDEPRAKLAWLPRQTEPARGVWGRVRKWMAGADRGIVSAGPEHVLPAPVALGMLLLFNEVRNASGE